MGFAAVEGKFTGQEQESGMLRFWFRFRNTVPSSVYRLRLRPLIPQVNIDEPRSDFPLAPKCSAALWRLWSDGSGHMRLVIFLPAGDQRCVADDVCNQRAAQYG